MSKPIEVGCIVEVIRARNFPDWVGRVLVVTGVNPSHQERGAVRYTTSPHPKPAKLALGWRPQCLRRIDPPDWEAPRVTNRELTTEGT